MLTTFAVQTITPGANVPEFIIVGAENAQEALGAAARQCVEYGKEDTQIIAVFTSDDLSLLAIQMDEANKRLLDQDK